MLRTLTAISLTIAMLHGAIAAGEAEKVVVLPDAKKDGGKPLMQALAARRTQRDFDPEATLDDQTLSNLLWAAFGINRADGKRTAPSAVNWQEIDIYVALAKGLYRYDAKGHALELVKDGDLRAQIGKQKFTADAAVGLVYVADFSRMGRAQEKDKVFYSAVDTGYISQNVYLFCASEDLATVVLGMVDKPALHKAMGLGENQHIILSQPVGKPKK